MSCQRSTSGWLSPSASHRARRRCVGQDRDQIESPAQHPDRHQVRVGVVVETRLVGPRVAVVVLVGPHHAADHVAVAGVVVGRDAGPEAGDLEEQLGAVEGDEADVGGRLVVEPDVVGDRDVDVALPVRVIRQPALRARVEMQLLALLAAVGAALPGEHRPCVARLAGGPARLRQAPEAITEQRAGQLRQVEGQEREDEQLVPEDVAAIGLPVQASGRHADIEVDRVVGDRLQQVEDVEVDDQARLFAAVLEPQLEPLPKVVHADDVRLEQLLEPGRAFERAARLAGRLGDRRIATGVEADDLVDRHRRARIEVDRDLVPDRPALRGVAPAFPERPPVGMCRGAGGKGDLDPGLIGAGLQRDRLRVDLLGLGRVEVEAREVPVARNPAVLDLTVEPRADLYPARPVLGVDRRLQGGQMAVGHADEPSLGQPRCPPLAIAETQPAVEHAPMQVELLLVVEQLDTGEVEPRSAVDPEAQGQPVGEVDDALVGDGSAGDLGAESVEDAGGVGPRIVDTARARLGSGAAGREVAVTGRAEGLPELLLSGIEALVDQRPMASPTGLGGDPVLAPADRR